MHSLVHVEWERFELAHLRGFLADADEEGLTWEAKADEPADGGKRIRPEHVQRSACAFANTIGGYVVIGARRENGKWELPGVAPPSPEPGLWLDQALGGLRPVPRYERKVWRVGEGRFAAVVRVEPLTTAPCMTRHGAVFERVSSETVHVTDPARLHELIRRGQDAQHRAELFAARAAEHYAGTSGPFADHTVRFGMGLAATNYQPDISARLFHSRFPLRLQALMDARLYRDLGQERDRDMRRLIQQDHIELAADGAQLHWAVRASWDGSVSVLAAVRPESAAIFSATDFALWPAWKLAAEVVELLGGFGDGRMCLIVTIRNQSVNLPGRTIPPLGPETLYGRLQADTRIQRVVLIAPPTDAEIGSIQRELLRASGQWVHEGQPDLEQVLRG
jgi:hypothetical protein